MNPILNLFGNAKDVCRITKEILKNKNKVGILTSLKGKLLEA